MSECGRTNSPRNRRWKGPAARASHAVGNRSFIADRTWQTEQTNSDAACANIRRRRSRAGVGARRTATSSYGTSSCGTSPATAQRPRASSAQSPLATVLRRVGWSAMQLAPCVPSRAPAGAATVATTCRARLPFECYVMLLSMCVLCVKGTTLFDCIVHGPSCMQTGRKETRKKRRLQTRTAVPRIVRGTREKRPAPFWLERSWTTREEGARRASGTDGDRGHGRRARVDTAHRRDTLHRTRRVYSCNGESSNHASLAVRHALALWRAPGNDGGRLWQPADTDAARSFRGRGT